MVIYSKMLYGFYFRFVFLTLADICLQGQGNQTRMDYRLLQMITDDLSAATADQNHIRLIQLITIMLYSFSAMILWPFFVCLFVCLF